MGGVNDPLTAVPEASMRSSWLPEEGKQGGGTELWPSSGWLAALLGDIGRFVQVPHDFWRFWGITWTPVAPRFFPHAMEGQSLQ